MVLPQPEAPQTLQSIFIAMTAMSNKLGDKFRGVQAPLNNLQNNSCSRKELNEVKGLVTTLLQELRAERSSYATDSMRVNSTIILLRPEISLLLTWRDVRMCQHNPDPLLWFHLSLRHLRHCRAFLLKWQQCQTSLMTSLEEVNGLVTTLLRELRTERSSSAANSMRVNSTIMGLERRVAGVEADM